MVGGKMEILWSPNFEDKFLTFGKDVRLYRVDVAKDRGVTKGQVENISDSNVATLLHANADENHITCLAFYPKAQPENLLATGLANGKVLLTSLGRTGASDPDSLIGKEFVPKHPRQCNALAWNPVRSNLLLEALEKSKPDHSLLVWDVFAKTVTETTSERRLAATHPEPFPIKPLVELGQSEATLSLCWFRHEPDTLVAGMHHKCLKIFDIRGGSKTQGYAHTKAVYGVQVDPHSDYRLASFVEGQVAIWDTRSFDKPLLTMEEAKPILKLAWSPTRCGLLACLPRSSAIVKLYDIQHTSVDELESAVMHRIIQPAGLTEVASFDWHPTNKNRMITISPTNQMKDIHTFERIALNWSPNGFLSWACGNRILQCRSEQLCAESCDDISIQMRQRVLRGYGIQSDIANNSMLTGDDNESLKSLWQWLHHVKSLNAKTNPKTSSPIVGVKYVLQKDATGGASRSEPDILKWHGVDANTFRSPKKIFRSEERLKALQLCGWGFDRDHPSTPFIDRLENEGQFQRAAAIAVFTLKLRRAIRVLNESAPCDESGNQAGESSLNAVAMALSGYTEEAHALWKEMCGPFSTQLQHPYLRAMFAFLVNANDAFDGVLNESMSVGDRVAFACMYLPDRLMHEFVDTLTKQLVRTGNLDGILLTGLSPEGVDLLERYVDTTGDVQTACCVCVQGLSSADLARDPRVRAWISEYRALLDTWRLWHERAEFDVYQNKCENVRPDVQVFVSCNFCGKSIGYSTAASRNRLMYGGMAHKSKSTSCQGCRKPLPRCALCLINMGTVSGTARHKPLKGTEDESDKLSKLSNWFTWCQTCRHGGHADHMTSWFNDHSECPVTGCNCKCSTLDVVGKVFSEQSN